MNAPARNTRHHPRVEFLDEYALRDPSVISALREEVCRAGTPLFGDEGTVLFVYDRPAQTVELVGDMNEWLGGDFLARLPGSDLFCLQARYPLDARLEYVFRIDGDAAFTADPLNPWAVPNGWGRMSELRMPRCRIVPELGPYADGRLGDFSRVRHHVIEAGALPYPHDLYVLVPPGYERDEGLPALYLQDGADYIEYAHLPAVLTQLIAQQRIRPLIAVFIAPPNRHQPAQPNRTTEYGLSEDYIRFVADEVVPLIDTQYGTCVHPADRMVVGASYGGLISAALALRRPDVFGAVYSQSGYFSFCSDALIAEMRSREQLPFRFYFDVGTFERAVGRVFLPEEEGDFLTANRRLHDLIAERNEPVWYREYPEGHTWGNWRAHLVDVLVEHFRPSTE